MYFYQSNKYWTNILNYYKLNYLILISFPLIAILISYYSFKDYIKSIFTLLLSTFIIWLAHFGLHNNNRLYIISKLHQATHHGPFGQTDLGKIIEFFIVELFFFGTGILLIIVLLIHRVTNYYILNPYVILFWTVSFMIIHEFSHYDNELNEVHKDHHQNPQTSFFPDFWDIVFKTKQDKKKICKEFIIVPVLVLVAIFIIFFINSPIDFIKYFS